MPRVNPSRPWQAEGSHSNMSHVLPTVEQVLALPVLQRGDPEVTTGSTGLQSRVRWVHVSELFDIAYLLRGGELILTTGIALPTEPKELARYIDDLAGAAASGLVIELGRKFTTLPAALVARARRRGLPLIALHQEVRFVAVTEAVHTLIVNAQLELLRASELAHATFTDLSVEGASAAAIVEQVAQMAGRPVVLENLAHQVLAFHAGAAGSEDLLHDWEQRSRLRRTTERTELSEGDESWLITIVGARGEQWGRLVMPLGGPPTPYERMLLERGATALALNRLVDRDRETLERQTHRTLITQIRDRQYSSAAEVYVRAQALGVPLADRLLTGVIVRVSRKEPDDNIEAEARKRDDAEQVARAVRAAGVSALVGTFTASDVGVLVALAPDESQERALTDLARAVHLQFAKSSPATSARVSVGSTVMSVHDVRRSFREAEHVAEAAHGSSSDKLYYQLPDVRIRGLLHILRDDPRMQTFVERELGPLLAHDEREGSALVEALRAYLAHGRNKSAAADAIHVSRPAFYQRLARIEQILDVDLDAVDSCLSLHVALLALDSIRSRG